MVGLGRAAWVLGVPVRSGTGTAHSITRTAQAREERLIYALGGCSAQCPPDLSRNGNPTGGGPRIYIIYSDLLGCGLPAWIVSGCEGAGVAGAELCPPALMCDVRRRCRMAVSSVELWYSGICVDGAGGRR